MTKELTCSSKCNSVIDDSLVAPGRAQIQCIAKCEGLEHDVPTQKNNLREFKKEREKYLTDLVEKNNDYKMVLKMWPECDSPLNNNINNGHNLAGTWKYHKVEETICEFIRTSGTVVLKKGKNKGLYNVTLNAHAVREFKNKRGCRFVDTKMAWEVSGTSILKVTGNEILIDNIRKGYLYGNNIIKATDKIKQLDPYGRTINKPPIRPPRG